MCIRDSTRTVRCCCCCGRRSHAAGCSWTGTLRRRSCAPPTALLNLGLTSLFVLSENRTSLRAVTGHAHLLEQGHVPDISAQRACCLIRRAVYNRDVVLPHGPTVCCNKDAHGLTGKVKDPPCVQSWTAWRRSFAQSSTGRCLRSWSRLRHHSLCRSRRANFYQMLALHSCPATPRSQCALFLLSLIHISEPTRPY